MDCVLPSVAAKGSDAVFCGPWRRKRQPAAEDSIRPGPGPRAQNTVGKRTKTKRKRKERKGNACQIPQDYLASGVSLPFLYYVSLFFVFSFSLPFFPFFLLAFLFLFISLGKNQEERREGKKGRKKREQRKRKKDIAVGLWAEKTNKWPPRKGRPTLRSKDIPVYFIVYPSLETAFGPLISFHRLVQRWFNM